MSSEISLNPVGKIITEEGHFYLSIKAQYRNALKELDGFSHMIVIWWGNQTDSPKDRDILVAEKPYKGGPDTVGIFATRSPARPNPVLITTTAILHIDRERGVVQVPWIDAETDSPVIDIKPYQPSLDKVKNVRAPGWCSTWPQWYEDSAVFDWSNVFNG